MIPIIGARDYIEPLGFFIYSCPHCGRDRVFSVYETRRKLTLYFVPTGTVRKQLVMECSTCHNRWGIPDADREAVLSSLMSQEQIMQRQLQAQMAAHAKANQPPKQQPRKRTYYQVMQVDQDAERDVIEAAFRRLAIKYHPDTSDDPMAEAKMREVLNAREILLDEVKRRVYDESLGIVRYVEALRPSDV